MVYDVLRFPNFAQVEFGTVGAYVALAAAASAGFGIIAGVIVALVVMGTMGVVFDRLIFAKLRGRSPIVLMVASFGLGIAMRSTARAIWGPAPQSFPVPLLPPWHFMGGRINGVEIGIILATVACLIGFYLLLNRTNLGIAMRATADNPELSEASGIVTERIIRSVWFIGSAFGALGGVMLGLETQITPTMGFSIIVPVFAAAIVGGIGSPFGAVLGALVIGFAESIGLAINWGPVLHWVGLAPGDAYVFIPTGYKPAAPFTLLILILLFRPQGIAGSKPA